MTNERRHPDDPGDPAVSQAYRELSNERAPEHLDHIVLNAARDAAKQRHRTAMAWFRPAAWVATVGLCLAIVLEVADMPLQDEDVFEAPAGKEQDTEAAADAPDAVTTPAQEAKSSKAQNGMVHTDNIPELERAKLEQEAPAAGRVDMDTAPAQQLPSTAPRRADPRDEAPAAIEVDALKDDDQQFLREAESRARLQSGSDEELEEAYVQGVRTLGTASEVAVESYCDEEQRADPNGWLECILDLENQGMPEAARFERELLREAFPDAYVPPDFETESIRIIRDP